MAADRLDIIRNTLFRHGSMRVLDLCEATNASIATIRRDLQRLQDDGVVERRHGAVRLAGGGGVELGFRARESHNLDAKVLLQPFGIMLDGVAGILRIFVNEDFRSLKHVLPQPHGTVLLLIVCADL